MNKVQRIIADFEDGDIEKWAKIFILDRRARHLTPGSIRWYRQKLGPSVDWCGERGMIGVFQKVRSV